MSSAANLLGAKRVNSVAEKRMILYCSQAKLDEQTVEEPKVKTVPFIDMKPEPVEVEEGKPAKFMVKVSGYPRPRVNWFVNGYLVVGVSNRLYASETDFVNCAILAEDNDLFEIYD